MPIPLTGLLRIYPRTASVISGAFSVSGNGIGSASPLATDAQIEAYYLTRLDTPADAPRTRYAVEIPAASARFVPSVGAHELQFSPDSSRILFDPLGTPTEIDLLSSDFPLGVTMSQLRLWWNGSYDAGPGRDRLIATLDFRFFGATVETETLTQGIIVSGDITTANDVVIPSGRNWSITQVMKQFGFIANVSAVVSGLTAQPFLRTDLFFIQAIYNTQRWDISTTTPFASRGSIANITDANAALDLFEEYRIYWVDETYGDANAEIPGWAGGIPIPQSAILQSTPEFLEFIMPEEVPPGGVKLILAGVGNGISFVGEFPLQNYNVTLVDGSGLYKLTPGLKHDTYYDRSVSPVSTTDIKIPDSLIKTGFFNAK